MVRPITAEVFLETAKSNMRSAEYCMLITLGERGEANARLVQPFEPEGDMTIWVGTWSKSRKVREILNDRRVTLAFHDKEDTAYVTLLGSAEIESDINKKRKYWREEWVGFIPQGPEGEDYVLVKFTPFRIEIMSFGSGILPQPYGLKPAVLVRSDDVWVLVDNGEK
ncbi:MAG: pyridoxamine 5'-phosphate oxidase family protein [Deltaproteobacteria bacterium]|nr:pyridoxamine 5'-phosphate oxidase family protein [Deltaproteobacteria bacterium]